MKKKLLPFILLILSIQTEAQVIIQGQFANMQDWGETIYLLAIQNQYDIFSSTNKYNIDTAYASKDGKFHFSIDKLPCENCLYRIDIRPKHATGAFVYTGTSKENYALFELKNGLNVKITGDANQLTKTFEIDNKDILWSYEKLRKLREPLYTVSDSVANIFNTPQYLAGKNIDSLKGQLMQFLMNKYEQNNILLSQYMSHSPSFYDKIVGLRLYDYDFDIENDIVVYDSVLNQVNKYDKEHPFCKQVQVKVNEAKYILPKGSQAPSLILLDTSNSKIDLFSIGNNLILIDFWASWCGPCRIENKTTVKPLFDKYKDKGFIVMSVSMDDDRTKWLKAVVNDGMNWIKLA